MAPFPATGTWSTAAPLPERIQEHHGALFRGRIYVAGGIDSTNQTTKVVYRFDPRGNTWERLARSPGAAAPHAARRRQRHALCDRRVRRRRAVHAQSHTVDLSRRREHMGDAGSASGAARRVGGRRGRTARSSSWAASARRARSSTRRSSTIRARIAGATTRPCPRNGIISRRRW